VLAIQKGYMDAISQQGTQFFERVNWVNRASIHTEPSRYLCERCTHNRIDLAKSFAEDVQLE